MVNTAILKNGVLLLNVRSRQIHNPSRKWGEKFQIDHIKGELENRSLLIPDIPCSQQANGHSQGDSQAPLTPAVSTVQSYCCREMRLA